MGMFNGFQEQLPTLKHYWVQIFEHKQMQRISESGSKYFPFTMLQYEFFLPSNLKNRKSSSIFEKLAVTSEKQILDLIHKETKPTENISPVLGKSFVGGKVFLIFTRHVQEFCGQQSIIESIWGFEWTDSIIWSHGVIKCIRSEPSTNLTPVA